MRLFYHNEYGSLDFNYFCDKGFQLIELDRFENDYSNLKDNDCLFIKLDEIDKIKKDCFLKIILFVNHEFCNEFRRFEIIKNSNPKYKIWFLTTHIDFYTKQYDLKIENRIYPLKTIFSEKAFHLNLNRNKKFNFFNRSINLRRLKVFELIQKNNINLKDCYFTFGNVIKKHTFSNIESIKDFVNFRDKNNELKIDIDYLENKSSEFFLYENLDDVKYGYIHSSDSIGMYDKINEQSLDSFVSLTIESSADSGMDYRLTEKTIRNWLCKNMYLTLQCRGYTKLLNENGIETFEKYFGLDNDWDDCDEIERIEKFVNALKMVNELSYETVKDIYLSDEVQNKIEKNYRFVLECFNDQNILNEIENKFYENNVFK